MIRLYQFNEYYWTVSKREQTYYYARKLKEDFIKKIKRQFYVSADTNHLSSLLCCEFNAIFMQ